MTGAKCRPAQHREIDHTFYFISVPALPELKTTQPDNRLDPPSKKLHANNSAILWKDHLESLHERKREHENLRVPIRQGHLGELCECCSPVKRAPKKLEEMPPTNLSANGVAISRKQCLASLRKHERWQGHLLISDRCKKFPSLGKFVSRTHKQCERFKRRKKSLLAPEQVNDLD